MSAGWFLIGLAVGLLLGGLSTYGLIFAWAIKVARDEGEEDRFE